MERNRLSAALLAGGCAAAWGTCARAHRSLDRRGRLFLSSAVPDARARARPADGARCDVLDPCSATRGIDTRLGS
eukprot:398491-Prymnesium_polylepis.1